METGIFTSAIKILIHRILYVTYDCPVLSLGRENETTEMGNGAPVFAFLVCFSFCLPARSRLQVKMTLLKENIYNFSNNLKT